MEAGDFVYPFYVANGECWFYEAEKEPPDYMTLIAQESKYIRSFPSQNQSPRAPCLLKLAFPPLKNITKQTLTTSPTNIFLNLACAGLVSALHGKSKIQDLLFFFCLWNVLLASQGGSHLQDKFLTKFRSIIEGLRDENSRTSDLLKKILEHFICFRNGQLKLQKLWSLARLNRRKEHSRSKPTKISRYKTNPVSNGMKTRRSHQRNPARQIRDHVNRSDKYDELQDKIFQFQLDAKLWLKKLKMEASAI